MPRIYEVSGLSLLIAKALSNSLEAVDGHYRWVGNLNEYGDPQFLYKCKYYHPHRIIYSVHIDEDIPTALYVRRTCDFKFCMNPEHMELCNSNFDKCSLPKKVLEPKVWPIKVVPQPPSLQGFNPEVINGLEFQKRKFKSIKQF